ncbi:MAG: hypothetical protein J0H71_20090 [Rhizobiales bacterium]|nr:hypothetical protein [Hyphomicrobiales bacterium]
MTLINVVGLGERARIAWLLSTTMLTGFVFAIPTVSGHGQTIVGQGTLVVSSDAQPGGDSVIVDNSANLNAALQINAGVTIGNEIHINNQGILSKRGHHFAGRQ